MSNYTSSPNMSLPIPVVGADPGPDYANNINSSLGILDQHNHSPGSGNIITPSGLNISSDLTFNTNNITTLRSTRFANLSGTLSPTSGVDTNCLYVSAGNLYFNDGAGYSPIQITSGGAVNATSSGISSGTNTASFVSNVLVVNAASNTPANIKVGSVLLGNNSSGSKYLTLAPPSAMGSNFGLVLPNIPGATSFMQIDTSGNMSAGPAISAGITSSNIAAATITGSNIAAATITGSNIASATISGSNIVSATIAGSNIAANTVTSSNIKTYTIADTNMAGGSIALRAMAASNYAASAGANFFTASSSFVTVTNLNAGIIAVPQRIIKILIQPTYGTSGSTIGFIGLASGSYQILINGTPIFAGPVSTTITSLSFVDYVSRTGSVTYSVQVLSYDGSTYLYVTNMQMIVWQE